RGSGTSSSSPRPAPTGTRWPATTTLSRGPRSSSAATEMPDSSCTERPSRTSPAEMPDPVRIGLLGRGTVGGAFAELLPEHAGAPEAAWGRRPELSGVLTRGEGDFGEILQRSALIVELIGGTEPARGYVLEALRAGVPVVTANKQLLAQHGDELFEVAREAGVQLRFEAAVAGVIPIVRVIQESFGATEISKVFWIVNGT